MRTARTIIVTILVSTVIVAFHACGGSGKNPFEPSGGIGGPTPTPTPTPSPTPTPGSGGSTPTPTPTPTPAPPSTPTPTPVPNNNPPSLSSVTAAAANCHPRPGSPCTVNITASASDPDGDAPQYTWSGCASGTGATQPCSVTALSAHTATVTVTDGKGGSATGSATVTGVNSAPTVTVSNASCHPTPTTPCNATLTTSTSDSDGDTVTYAWSGCASGTSASGICSVSALVAYTGNVSVSDGWASKSASGTATGTNQALACTVFGSPSVKHHLDAMVTFSWTDGDGDTSNGCSSAIDGDFGGDDRVCNPTQYGPNSGRDDFYPDCPTGGAGVIHVTIKDVWNASGTCDLSLNCTP
jgi:hypothetical protein